MKNDSCQKSKNARKSKFYQTPDLRKNMSDEGKDFLKMNKNS